ncbi:hypothetical protein M231_05873 [Tremella mesenterica]|uniref:Uncharacterized protein n=1 Tax=Tremella mesenterica TaxID=5217 RepID=A0A4Q1BH43_TREME|nr:uncharacterized protein TREMEDRAFT_65555 [Tremella mesenterica DSM 1558]EIW66284.1 hypothetical protein TREMEDRAFT_65555 [Tremella mesenterica DSM 1558]RXK36899.1 hypothetical protein M231_05873 [Tremella mesenterica]
MSQHTNSRYLRDSATGVFPYLPHATIDWTNVLPPSVNPMVCAPDEEIVDPHSIHIDEFDTSYATPEAPFVPTTDNQRLVISTEAILAQFNATDLTLTTDEVIRMVVQPQEHWSDKTKRYIITTDGLDEFDGSEKFSHVRFMPLENGRILKIDNTRTWQVPPDSEKWFTKPITPLYYDSKLGDPLCVTPPTRGQKRRRNGTIKGGVSSTTTNYKQKVTGPIYSYFEDEDDNSQYQDEYEVQSSERRVYDLPLPSFSRSPYFQ